MSRLFLTGGASQVFFHEEQDGKVSIETVADVSPVVERAKALHNAGRTKTRLGDRHVAEIPIIVLDAWARKQGLTFQHVMQDDALLNRFLQDPDHSYFVIDKGSVR